MNRPAIIAVFTMASFFLLRSSSSSASDELVDFTVITDKGWVRYTVGGNWSVLWMEPKPPKTTAGYQIPNQADEGTSDSTNFGFITIQEDSPDMIASEMKRAVTKWGSQSLIQTKHDGWTIFSQEGKQGETLYTIRNAYKHIADVRVFVRFAWPHLKKNPLDYDAQMNGLFYKLLNSVTGGLGKYQLRQGEIIRRKEP